MQKVMEEFKNGTLKSSSGETVTSRKQAIAIGLSESGESKKEKGGVAVVVKSMDVVFEASEILLMKGKDVTHLHKKTITTKNGVTKTVWVAPVEVPTEHGHPSDKHAEAVAMYGAKKKYMSKEKAKEHVAKHVGEAEAEYAHGFHEQDSKNKLPQDLKDELESNLIKMKNINSKLPKGATFGGSIALALNKEDEVATISYKNPNRSRSERAEYAIYFNIKTGLPVSAFVVSGTGNKHDKDTLLSEIKKSGLKLEDFRNKSDEQLGEAQLSLDGKRVQMSTEDFEEEHKKLPKVLENGTKAERKKEANDQAEELKKVEKEKNVKKSMTDTLSEAFQLLSPLEKAKVQKSFNQISFNKEIQ